jgi:hypothetical protein
MFCPSYPGREQWGQCLTGTEVSCLSLPLWPGLCLRAERSLVTGPRHTGRINSYSHQRNDAHGIISIYLRLYRYFYRASKSHVHKPTDSLSNTGNYFRDKMFLNGVNYFNFGLNLQILPNFLEFVYFLHKNNTFFCIFFILVTIGDKMNLKKYLNKVSLNKTFFLYCTCE